MKAFVYVFTFLAGMFISLKLYEAFGVKGLTAFGIVCGVLLVVSLIMYIIADHKEEQ